MADYGFNTLAVHAGAQGQPQPLDEVRHGVDHGDLDVGRGQPAGEGPGRVGPGIAGAEDDDAVLHVRIPSVRLLSGPERESGPIPDRNRMWRGSRAAPARRTEAV